MKRILSNHSLLAFLLIAVFLLLFVDPALAGPGGYIVKGLFKTWYGKLLLIALTIILLPLIIYVRTREYFAVRKNKKDLQQLATVNKMFDWFRLEKEVKNIVTRVYTAWRHENMEEVSQFVSNWYWQNQQLVVLDRWKEHDLVNICNLKQVGKIKPLHIQISGAENFEESRIVFSVQVNIEDYLQNRSTGNVVEGRPGYSDEEIVWVLEYTGEKWVLDDIQPNNLTLAFAKLKNQIPEVVFQPGFGRAAIN